MEVAVDSIAKAIYLKQKEVIVGRLVYHIVPALCFLSSATNSMIGNIVFKKTRDSIAQAK